MKKKIVRVSIFWVPIFMTVAFFCSKNPGEPEPTPDPCLECPPVFVEVSGDTVFVDVPGDTVRVEIPVTCKKIDATAEFTVTKDQSGPNDFLIVAEGYPDEEVSITDTSPVPVDNWLHEAWQRDPGEGAVWIDPDAPIAEGRQSADALVCGTLEGVHKIDFNDWIIQGVKKELYPCKLDIFELTYESVAE